MTERNTQREQAGMLIRSAIRRAAVEAFAATETHEPVEGYQVLTRSVLDDPLAGVRAALLAGRVALNQMREYAEAARGAGRSWGEIAEALDLVSDAGGQGPVPGEVAFEWLIEGHDPAGDHGPRWPSTASAWWTCDTCGARITDRGPFEPHPDDNESGHDPACARRAAAIRDYKRERGDL